MVLLRVVSASDGPLTECPPCLSRASDWYSSQNWQAYLKSLGLSFFHASQWLNLPLELLIQFSAVFEPVLCASVTIWFGSATKSDRRKVQWTVRTAEKIIGAPLPTLQELYISTVKKSHTLRPLPLWTLATERWALEHPGTSFPPQAIFLMNI